MLDVVLARLLRNDSNCIDVGAHLGSFTRDLYQYAPDGNHILIEAVAFKADWLKTRYPRAVIHQCAVSDSNGEIIFYENTTQSGFSSLTKREAWGQHIEYKVKCCELDTLIPVDSKIDFLKIDVEGHEWEVVKGAKQLIESQRPIVMFEAGAAHDAEIEDTNLKEMFRYWTEKAGYDVFGIFDYYYSRPPLTASAFQSYRTYPFLCFNFLAVPRASWRST